MLTELLKKVVFSVFHLFLVFGFCYGAESTAAPPEDSGINLTGETLPVFPRAIFTEFLNARDIAEAGRPYSAATEAEMNKPAAVSSPESILLNNDILAFYGHPRSRNMGILGRHTKEELNKRLTDLALEYEKAGGKKVIKAFYLIFGTVWPDANIGILPESLVREYIEFAQENNILVFLDHQIGKFTPAEGLNKMLPWLKYPNVHLALDPEWRTTKPNLEIGTVTAEELNQVQRIMENYMTENNIPGERLLVIHQFNYRMISNREKVQTNFTKVRMVHCADGFGPPAVKKSTYAHNAQATNIPVKGFKLFYNFEIPGAGVDIPLMAPKDVYGLNPRPYLVMYQ